MRRSARMVAECPTLLAFRHDCAAHALSHRSSRLGSTWLIHPYCLMLQLSSLVNAIMNSNFINLTTSNMLHPKSSFCAVTRAMPRAICCIGFCIDIVNACISLVNIAIRELRQQGGSASAALHGMHAHFAGPLALHVTLGVANEAALTSLT